MWAEILRNEAFQSDRGIELNAAVRSFTMDEDNHHDSKSISMNGEGPLKGEIEKRKETNLEVEKPEDETLEQEELQVKLMIEWAGCF